MNSDGSARVSPAPDIMSLLGSAADRMPREPEEKRKSRESNGRNASESTIYFCGIHKRDTMAKCELLKSLNLVIINHARVKKWPKHQA